MSSPDQIQRFTFDNTDVRGELVGLNLSLQEVLNKHQYPQAIAQQLGKMMAASLLLSDILKIEGRICLQARLTGDIQLLQAESTDQGEVRAIAHYAEDFDHNKAAEEISLGEGQLVITLEPKGGKPYQGIVPFNLSGNNDQAGNELVGALEGYFQQSEQLETRFWLACQDNVAAGFMLQQLPESEGSDQDAWARISHLASTVKTEELLQLDNDNLLYRLYHEEQVRLYPAKAAKFACSCSKERTASAIKQVGLEELTEILAEQGKVSVDCQFCLQHYSFDKTQIDELFASPKSH